MYRGAAVTGEKINLQTPQLESHRVSEKCSRLMESSVISVCTTYLRGAHRPEILPHLPS